MANLFQFCHENTSNIKLSCICCASQNGIMINSKTCSHIGVLKIFIKFKLDPDEMQICNQCHDMLRKIDMFRRQVEESVALLNKQSQLLKITKLHDLRYSHIVIVDTLESETLLVDTKLESFKIYTDQHNTHTELNTDIKIEHESVSDYENDSPLTGVKLKKQKTEIDKYEEKIVVVMLSEKAFEEEREKLRNSEGYLKLPYKCESCIVGFDHEANLKRHMDNRHDKKTNSKFHCRVCQSVLGSELSYKEHMRRHFRRYACMVCGRWFNQDRSAIHHYNLTHGPIDAAVQIQPNYTCNECGFETISYGALRNHRDSHKAKPQCKICGNKFSNKNGLRVHTQNVHKATHRFKCTECDKSYKAKSGLYTHIQSAHRNTPKPFCAKCQTHYRDESTLRQHLRTHSNHVTENDRKFICDECGEKFVGKHQLCNHINWVHMKRGHHCDICLKMFPNNGRLRKHIKFVHEKRRPPKNKICDHCGKAFTTQMILQTHIRTHTGEKPLQCNFCPARFAHSGALYTHKKLLHAASRNK